MRQTIDMPAPPTPEEIASAKARLDRVLQSGKHNLERDRERERRQATIDAMKPLGLPPPVRQSLLARLRARLSR